MPKTAEKSKLTWNKNGPVAAQLFRDLYFGKYKPNPDTDKFEANEIFNDPARPYSDLNRTSFPRHIATTWERVQTYKRSGTGLGTETFRRLVNLQVEPPPEDRAPVKDGDKAEDSDDDPYEDDAEEDITLGDFDEESAFEELKKNGGKNISDSKPNSKKQSNSQTKVTNNTENMPESNKLKFMFQEPDGRLALVYHLESGFDGTFELNEGNNIIYQKQIKSPWMYNAQKVYERLGLTADNVHVVGLQAEMDAQRKRDIAAMGQDPDTYTGEIWTKTLAFELPFEVFPYFIDSKGNETTDVWLDGGDDGEWVFFWLKDASKRKKGTSARINRNRKARRDNGNGNNERTGQSPRNGAAGFECPAKSPRGSGNANMVDSDSL